jgi:hypothetical protein
MAVQGRSLCGCRETLGRVARSRRVKPEAVSRRIPLTVTGEPSRRINHQLPLAEWRGSKPASD